MSKSQVTITLGRSGQRVVKRPRSLSDGASAEGYAGISLPPMNKRIRGESSRGSSAYDRVTESRVGRNDLRLKLMHKRISRTIQKEIEQRRKMELRDKKLRTVHSPNRPETSLLRHVPPTRRAGEPIPVDSLRRSYSSHALEGAIRRSPDRVLKVSRAISPPPLSSTNEVSRVATSRSIDALRTGRLYGSDVLVPSRTRAPAPVPMRTTHEIGKLVTELPPASGSGAKTPYLVEQPLTVSSLLHSLGLEKYSINFRAEEVDMAVLKQMGDRDLKELGIPMGPRKKILLALLPQSRQPI